MSPGRLFRTRDQQQQMTGPVRSTTVTRHDGRTSSRLVDDDRRRVRDGMSVTFTDALYTKKMH